MGTGRYRVDSHPGRHELEALLNQKKRLSKVIC